MASRRSVLTTARRRQAKVPQPGLLRQLLTTPRLGVPLLCSILFLVIMLLLAIWGERGFLAMWRQQRAVARLAREIEAIEAENRHLGQEIERLRHDPRYIEKIAREELGMVRPGELVFEFIE